MSKAGRSRTLLVLMVVSGTALGACLPAAPPPAAPAAPPPAPPAAPATTTTQPAEPASTVTGSCATTTPSGAADAGALGDAEALTPGEAARAAHTSAAEAIADPDIPGERGDVPVVVTSIGADGRPTVTTLDTTGPVDAASEARSLTVDVAAAGGEVIAVESDQTLTLDEPTATAADDPATSTFAVANDPRRSSQWAFNVVAFETAWATTRGAGVCVAVLDTGIQLDHPDFAGRIAGTYDLTSDPIEDGYGHGTHVAGIVAANADNAIGVAGSAPAVDLLVVKVLGDAGSGPSSATANGVIWAVDHGARVINLSLGSACATVCTSYAMAAAVDYAQAHDVVIVAAAGNDGTPGDPEYNWPSSPAALAWPIAVASIDQAQNRSTFSTQASYVDVAAPGSAIWSTAPTHATVAWPSGTSGYGGMSGTSMATPYVTGLVAILRSAHPTETAAQIRARVTGTVTDLGPAGWDSSFGLGLIEPIAALAG